MANPKTPIFRVSYAHIWKPQIAKSDGRKIYSLTAIFEPDADIKEMLAVAQAAKEKKFGTAKVPGFKKPFTRWTPESVGEEKYLEKMETNPEYDGKIVCVMKSYERAVGVVGPDAKPIIEQGEFYSGCYAIASYNAFAYDMPESKGVSFGLINIMKMKDGDPLSAMAVRAETDFQEVKLADYGIDNSQMFDNADLLEGV